MPTAALSVINNLFPNFNLQEFLITILVLCISLSIHEAAHAWAAYRLGDDTAALQGRLTLNPLAHLDPIGALCFIIARIGWAKPVPINPARFNHKYTIKQGILLTSLAGPVSNLALATVSAFLVYLTEIIYRAVYTGGSVFFITIWLQLLLMLYTANISLAMFNLLPVPPLDGYKVFGAALPGRLYYKLMEFERVIGLAFLLLIFFGRPVLSSAILAVVTFANKIFPWMAAYFR